MLVSDVLQILEALPEYIQHSLIQKSSDANGCTYKFLCRSGDRALREEVFIATHAEDSSLPLTQRRALEYIFIQGPR